MCGIAGFCDFSAQSDQIILKKMTDVLAHRGPDDYGYELFKRPESTIGLGHRRLSILDLSKLGRQPMHTPDNNYHIIYNGEIYNFLEIQKSLVQDHGLTFKSQSDTEVILKAYSCWGMAAVEKFRGMFAFVILDERRNKLILCRDRAGVKPLYYYWHNQCLLFSSELKSFHHHPRFSKNIHESGMKAYLKWGYIPAPHTIFEHTHKLLPGHYLELDLESRSLQKIKYWDAIDSYMLPKLDISFDEAVQELEQIFIKSFGYRMIADVPVGVFLSGGYDSATVAAILQKHQSTAVKTYTIGFDEDEYNEAPHALAIANYLECDHTQYICSPKDALNIIPTLPEIFDEPFGDSSAIPTILVSRMARENVTVALSADGGDEIFAGYTKYQTALKMWSIIKRMPKSLHKYLFKSLNIIPLEKIQTLFSVYNLKTRGQKIQQMLYADNIVDFMNITSQLFTGIDINQLLILDKTSIPTAFDDVRKIAKKTDLINAMLAIDYQTYLPDDILVKVDRATMSVALEGREPLLDHHILEFVGQLPPHFKYSNGTTKRLLKTIAYKYIPRHLLDRPKKGFSVPIHRWFRNELKSYFLHYLDQDRLKKQGLFDDRFVVALRDRYLAGHQENIGKLWQLLMFQMWMSRWL
ncbi:Asparagine synthase (glutamine-hydrolyzing) [Candidatus Magnetomorum sp. HK-1]|nr:Asparagine synthase (glutamine-hydrolyzing) [Candidatus Magnetomorum sp. HK-1]